MLNEPKTYSYEPKYSGGNVVLLTRSSRRSKLLAGGTYFRSVDRGELSNMISCMVSESNGKGVFIQVHDVMNSGEMVTKTNLVADVQVLSFNRPFDNGYETGVLISKSGGTVRAQIERIRWQIAGSTLSFTTETITDLGEVTLKSMNTIGGVRFTLSNTTWNDGDSLLIHSRVQYTVLSQITVQVTDPVTSVVTPVTGWDIASLRAALANSSTTWVKMPARGTTQTPANPEDVLDTGLDEVVMTAFSQTYLSGGDGLPASPDLVVTGPERALIHLNYAELDNGSLGEHNKVYEWVGESSSSGSWQIYA